MKNVSERNLKVEGYKKVDLDSYGIITKPYYKGGSHGFDSFPCDGLWYVQTKKKCKSTSYLIDKISELPELYPLANLALRKDDIGRAINKFLQIKNKSLFDIGQASYSSNEFAEFIVKFLVNQELGGGSRKILVEKKWITVEGNESETIHNW